MTEAAAQAYVIQAAALLNLPIAPEHLSDVAANLARLAATAGLLADFPCPAELQPAPVFEP